MMPAQQSLGADDLAVAAVGERLEMQRQGFVGDRCAQFLFDQVATAGGGVQRCVEGMETVAAIRFRPVECKVGMSHQAVGIAAVLGR